MANAVRSHSRQFPGGVVYENEFGSVRVAPSGYVHDIYVKPEHRGKGHAGSVLSLALEDADRHGVTLRTNAETQQVEGLLSRRGFVFSDADQGMQYFTHLPGMTRPPRKE